MTDPIEDAARAKAIRERPAGMWNWNANEGSVAAERVGITREERDWLVGEGSGLLDRLRALEGENARLWADLKSSIAVSDYDAMAARVEKAEQALAAHETRLVLAIERCEAVGRGTAITTLRAALDELRKDAALGEGSSNPEPAQPEGTQ